MDDKSAAGEAVAERMQSLLDGWEKTGLVVWNWTNPRWFRQAAAINAELIRFTCDRLQKDLAFQSESLKCRNPAEFQDLQAHFLKETFEHYSAETSRLVRMNRDALEAIADREPDGKVSGATRRPRRTREGRLSQRVRKLP